MLSLTKSRFAGKQLIQTLFFFLLVTQICFAQWVQVGLGDKAIKDIAARNSNIFAITSDSGSVYRSTDNGNNWTVIVDTSAVDIAIAPTSTVFMVKDHPSQYAAKLFSSSDDGDEWDTLNVIEQLPPPLPSSQITMDVSVSAAGLVFCGLHSSGWESYWTNIALSTDNGITWIFPGWGTRGFGGQLFDYKGESVISAGYYWDMNYPQSANNDVYLSTDNGYTWTDLGIAPVNDIGCHILSLCLNGNILLGGPPIWGIEGGLFLSTDSCTTWTQVSTIFPQAGLSIETGGTLVGTDSFGVFLFSDNGDSIGSFNEGLSNLNIHTFTTDNNGYVYVGTNHGLWRRPLSEIIVPVELTSFTATTNGKEVILSWSTATELNNLGFEIQRSTEGNEFFTVGFVNGHGTTTEQRNYSYADKNLYNGKYYYKLKQVDFNGTYEYSDVVEVAYKGFNSYLLEQNYPNPFNPTTTIGFGLQNKSNVKITILNAIGEEVAIVLNEERESGYHQVEFNAANLPSGVYFYQLKADSYVETKKMILIK